MLESRSPGRLRYLRWPDREKIRLQTLAEREGALAEARAKGLPDGTATTRDSPEPGYPEPKAKAKRSKRR